MVGLLYSSIAAHRRLEINSGYLTSQMPLSPTFSFWRDTGEPLAVVIKLVFASVMISKAIIPVTTWRRAIYYCNLLRTGLGVKPLQ